MSRRKAGRQFDEWGLLLPDGCESAVDVLFDGRRVWSFAPTAAVNRHGDKWVEWPRALRAFLHGTATITVRNHLSGTELATEEVQFGDRETRVQVVDGAGRPVVVDKWGKLNRPFDATDRAVIDGYLDQVQLVFDVLADECGVPAFLSYGSLLGAVREKRMIAHDVDVDIGYLSAHQHPADVTLESYAIERTLRKHGWQVLRQNGGFLALFLPQPDGTKRNMDIFTCFSIGDDLYQVHDTRITGDASVVLPLGEVELEGRTFPAPARPERMLEGAYGPGWRVPDPAFKFRPPKGLSRRIEGWLGGVKNHRPYWDPFYRDRGDQVPTEPSDFAQWATSSFAGVPGARLVDLGCGNGRDAVHFARAGLDVVGADFSGPALRRARRFAEREGVDVRFVVWNLNSLRESLVQAALLAREPGPRIVYARGLLTALNDQARAQFWTSARMLARDGGRTLLEFRTPQDRRRPKHFGTHFRRFLDPGLVIDEATRHGARVLDRVEGQGLARFKEEDPHVCRLVLDWP